MVNVTTLDFDKDSSLDEMGRAYLRSRIRVVENLKEPSWSLLSPYWGANYSNLSEPLRCGAGVGQSIFIGEVYDNETNLNYLNARYYEGSRGQFLSQDPVFWEIGQTQDGFTVLQNPQAQNSYAYAQNNPIVNKDPSGRIFDTVVDIGFIAYDLYRVGDAYFNGGDVQAELGYLGLDVAGAATPFATGFGAVARTAKVVSKAEEAKGVVKIGEAGGTGAGKKFPQQVKEQAYNESAGRCVFCGVNTQRGTPGPTQSNIDHAIPKSQGGNNTINNAQNTCRSCNQSKGATNSVQHLQKQLIKVLKAYIKKLGG